MAISHEAFSHETFMIMIQVHTNNNLTLSYSPGESNVLIELSLPTDAQW